MAKSKQNIQNVISTSFGGYMSKDVNESLLSKNTYSHARNATNNSSRGDIGIIGNEQSNYLCTNLVPYTIIGVIHIELDQWVIFSTDNINSEIGIFKEDICTYNKVVNDPCLNFNSNYLITGETKKGFDKTWSVYWADNYNPDRKLNLSNVPYIQICQTVNSCIECTDTTDLDCDKLRLERFVNSACVTISKGHSGTLLNGTYQAVIAYLENEERVSDYSTPSNMYSLFSHDNVGGALEIHFNNVDNINYDEFELVIIKNVNLNTVAYRFGTYSTHSRFISISHIDESLEKVPLEFIPINTPIFDKSEQITKIYDTLVRIAPTGKFDFNYQPLANNIVTKWQSVEYPADYYIKGNQETGYMRDEVYSFFIRWVYDTGDYSNSYHIPGREVNQNFNIPNSSTTMSETDITPLSNNAVINPGIDRIFESYNTATITSTPNTILPDGGIVIAEGDMAYWESNEFYPDDNLAVWGTLCGKHIRHHKMPDSTINGSCEKVRISNYNGDKIRILGVKFENIQPPVDNNGDLITNIVGYEILRGTREGNKSIIAKGIINSMPTYEIPNSIKSITGAYQNYPYNDTNQFDPFLSKVQPISQYDNSFDSLPKPITYDDQLFSFHSPDTQFQHPFLSENILKVYGEIKGTAEEYFAPSDKHPEHKLMTNFAFMIASFAGVGIALKSLDGDIKVDITTPYINGISGTSATGLLLPNTVASAAASIAMTLNVISQNANLLQLKGLLALSRMVSLTPQSWALAQSAMNIATASSTSIAGGMNGGGVNVTYDPKGGKGLSGGLLLLQQLPALFYFWAEGTQQTLDLIKHFVKYEQYAWTVRSHCFYDHMTGINSMIRSKIDDSAYISDNIHDFNSYRINNMYRNGYVAVKSSKKLSSLILSDDNTRQTIGSKFMYSDPKEHFTQNSYSHYVSISVPFTNQYGQLDSIKQQPIHSCVIDKNNNTTPVLFGGDIYINRYTEKNTFFYFHDWLYDQPDGFEFDYRLRNMIPYPRFWMDTKEIAVGEILSDIGSNMFSNPMQILNNIFGLANKYEHLDLNPLTIPPQAIGSPFFNWAHFKSHYTKAYMYLFNSGVRDFFVESEINTAFRDWEDKPEKRHYDSYTYNDLNTLFNTKYIKAGNYYKYDFSLSKSKQFNNYLSWGSMQARDYDPVIYEKAYVHDENKIIYSLPAFEESKRDNWQIYLGNNYKVFDSKVINIKETSSSGALIFFDKESPIIFRGSDKLTTDSGVDVVIGTGKLFSMAEQHIVNSDTQFEYGSTQNIRSIISTPYGMFWISQNQGKIFRYNGRLDEISTYGMNWWFDTYLPYKLIEQFPDYDLIDNPVNGIGCQAVYDNIDKVIYFTKRDYKLRDGININDITYIGDGVFESKKGGQTFFVTDEFYFEDASWTISFDPKSSYNKANGAWISFHDWHPNLIIPSREHFYTIGPSNESSNIWKHNDNCKSYCNFYGTDYPFDIEITISTGQQVNTLRNADYVLECYMHPDSCNDYFHLLDENFDRAIIYNSEQISGELRLNLTPKNNAPSLINYPVINPTSIDILYSKEEQHYRFNQFWDITKDRGEFTGYAVPMIINHPNGYTFDINSNYVDYQKNSFNRKKFRHYTNKLYLRRMKSGNIKMLFKIFNTKLQYSIR